ncbi:uncharacterized protein LY79DRAFT_4526 [Colletotrichum navitas]|uniref:Uncharacterized protein n=1 Tax=Colletotrichum navitas TaxID=681940 RepID=A0AAD8VCG6_9PEZI|nr:uncharacterized protein LY79DRAFT_4526 [Colletotrichum navitas]KAK1600036.1 hypothetical protein LY79DRAFT_4526 [Colletotrichum navitas]
MLGHATHVKVVNHTDDQLFSPRLLPLPPTTGLHDKCGKPAPLFDNSREPCKRKHRCPGLALVVIPVYCPPPLGARNGRLVGSYSCRRAGSRSSCPCWLLCFSFARRLADTDKRNPHRWLRHPGSDWSVLLKTPTRALLMLCIHGCEQAKLHGVYAIG